MSSSNDGHNTHRDGNNRRLHLNITSSDDKDPSFLIKNLSVESKYLMRIFAANSNGKSSPVIMTPQVNHLLSEKQMHHHRFLSDSNSPNDLLSFGDNNNYDDSSGSKSLSSFSTFYMVLLLIASVLLCITSILGVTCLIRIKFFRNSNHRRRKTSSTSRGMSLGYI